MNREQFRSIEDQLEHDQMISDRDETIRQQAEEIERLRGALYDAVIAVSSLRPGHMGECGAVFTGSIESARVQRWDDALDNE